jgi:hypothetical protein
MTESLTICTILHLYPPPIASPFAYRFMPYACIYGISLTAGSCRASSRLIVFLGGLLGLWPSARPVCSSSRAAFPLPLSEFLLRSSRCFRISVGRPSSSLHPGLCRRGLIRAPRFGMGPPDPGPRLRHGAPVPLPARHGCGPLSSGGRLSPERARSSCRTLPAPPGRVVRDDDPPSLSYSGKAVPASPGISRINHPCETRTAANNLADASHGILSCG